jgi:hypothetical protein
MIFPYKLALEIMQLISDDWGEEEEKVAAREAAPLIAKAVKPLQDRIAELERRLSNERRRP